MRGKDEISGSLFSYVDLEARVPRGHPLRAIRDLTNAALVEMSGEFEALYSRTGRPGIAPEKLLRALLLQAFYSIRSERQLMEQLEFNLLFRWFVGLGIDDRVWDATVFTKNRERLLAGDVASRFLAHLVSLPAVKRLLSQDHFSVDGTQIEAWASIKSFRAVDEEPPEEDDDGDGAGGGRNAARDFHGARWSNETHRSTTDDDCRLYRKGKGKEAKLSYMGHALMENRNGLVVDGLASRATGQAECLAGEVMVMRREEPDRAVTVGADKAYDTAAFVRTCKAFGAEAHAATTPRTGARISACRWRRARGIERARSTANGSSALRLGEDGGALLEDPASRLGPGGLAVHPGTGGLRPDPTAEAAEGRSITASARCRAAVGRSVTPPARLHACPRKGGGPQGRTAALHQPADPLRTNRADRLDHAKSRPKQPRLTAFFRSLLKRAVVTRCVDALGHDELPGIVFGRPPLSDRRKGLRPASRRTVTPRRVRRSHARARAALYSRRAGS